MTNQNSDSTTSTTRGAVPAGDPEDLLFEPMAGQATPETSFSAGDETNSREAWGPAGQWAQRAEDVIVHTIERQPSSKPEAQPASKPGAQPASKPGAQPDEGPSLRLRDDTPPAVPEEEPLMVQKGLPVPEEPLIAPLAEQLAQSADAHQASRPNLMAVSPAPPPSRPRVRAPAAPMRVVGAPRGEPKSSPMHLRPRPQPTIAGLCVAVAIFFVGWACAAWLWMGVGSVPLAIMSGTLGTLGAVMTFMLGSR